MGAKSSVKLAYKIFLESIFPPPELLRHNKESVSPVSRVGEAKAQPESIFRSRKRLVIEFKTRRLFALQRGAISKDLGPSLVIRWMTRSPGSREYNPAPVTILL